MRGGEKIIGFVPARGASKAIPLKNIKPFCGRPLIYWSLKALQDSPAIDKVYLATDSDEIASCANSFGFSKLTVYRRSAENSQDDSSTESVILEFISQENLNGADLFMLVQATNPFLMADDVTRAVEMFRSADYDSILSCSRTKRFFWEANGIPVNYAFMSRPRRQDFVGTLMENGAFYINQVGNILRYGNRLSGKIGIFEMEEFAGHELDEPMDWNVGEQLMRRHLTNHFVQTTSNVQLLLTDVDGVLTDSGMYYGQGGEELKKFNTRDGKGFEIVRGLGIKTGILTSEDTKIVERRAKKLKVDFLYQGVIDKLATATEICAKLDISMVQVAYIGDDLNDVQLLSAVGLAACPADAVDSVKNILGIVKLNCKGGEGALRELVNMIAAR